MKLKMLAALIVLQSCSSSKDLLYIQNAESYVEQNIHNYEPVLQPNDVLMIEVTSTVPEAAIPYNKTQMNNIVNNVGILNLNGYVVGVDNNINFPVLGKISVKDKTASQLEGVLNQQLMEGGHLINPTVTVRILNAKFTVLGEVNRPGTYNITEPRTTLFQALGMAGDMNITGKRKNVLLVREINGTRKIHELDLTNISFLDGPYYLLQPNDVIIVQPNYARVKSAGFIGAPSTLISVASFLLSLTIILTN